MMILIFGDDLYQSQKRLRDLKNSFKQKYGQFNLSLFEFEPKQETKASKIINEIESVPFLGTKRLIVIKELLAFGDQKIQEKIKEKLDHLPESSIVIFYESGLPKKNNSLYKKLIRLAKVEEFLTPRGPALISWIKKEAARRGAEIDQAAAEKLATFSGRETLRISNELDKLVNFAHPRMITSDDVSLLVKEKIEPKIFDLVDGLAQRDSRASYRALKDLLASGEKEPYLLSMINFGLRNIVLVKSQLEERENLSSAEIAKTLGLHPFVVSKAISSARLFSMDELKKIYRELVKMNLKMRQSDNNPALLLDLFLAQVCER